MGKIHRDIMCAIVRLKVPIDDLRNTLMRNSHKTPDAVYHVLDLLSNLEKAVEFKVKELENHFNI
jgi:hypothetical protein